MCLFEGFQEFQGFQVSRGFGGLKFTVEDEDFDYHGLL